MFHSVTTERFPILTLTRRSLHVANGQAVAEALVNNPRLHVSYPINQAISTTVTQVPGLVLSLLTLQVVGSCRGFLGNLRSSPYYTV